MSGRFVCLAVVGLMLMGMKNAAASYFLNPAITVQPVTEGNSGSKTMTFVVRVASSPSDCPPDTICLEPTYAYAVNTGTATPQFSGLQSEWDYSPQEGDPDLVVINDDQTFRVEVPIYGDSRPEGNETVCIKVHALEPSFGDNCDFNCGLPQVAETVEACGTIIDDDVQLQLPIADLRCDGAASVTAIAGQTVALDASQSFDPDGTLTSCILTNLPGNGSITMQGGCSSVSRVFNTPGSYSPTLTVTDNDGLQDVATCSVTVNPAPPPTVSTLQFNSTTFSGSEAEKFATITVVRSGSAQGQVSVVVNTQSDAAGGAKSPADYAEQSKLLTWANNDSGNKSFTVPIVDDADIDGGESFRVVLVNPAPQGMAMLGGNSSATVNITDNDNRAAGTPATVSTDEGPITVAADTGILTLLASVDEPVSFAADFPGVEHLATIDVKLDQVTPGQTVHLNVTIPESASSEQIYFCSKGSNKRCIEIPGELVRQTSTQPKSVEITVSEGGPLDDESATSAGGTSAKVATSITFRPKGSDGPVVVEPGPSTGNNSGNTNSGGGGALDLWLLGVLLGVGLLRARGVRAVRENTMKGDLVQ